jgi:hypothetical protein
MDSPSSHSAPSLRAARRAIYLMVAVVAFVAIAGNVVFSLRSTEPAFVDETGVVEFSGFVTPRKVNWSAHLTTRVRLASGQLISINVPGDVPLPLGSKVTIRGYTRAVGRPYYFLVPDKS